LLDGRELWELPREGADRAPCALAVEDAAGGRPTLEREGGAGARPTLGREGGAVNVGRLDDGADRGAAGERSVGAEEGGATATGERPAQGDEPAAGARFTVDGAGRGIRRMTDPESLLDPVPLDGADRGS